jgi:hypothetical protein
MENSTYILIFIVFALIFTYGISSSSCPHSKEGFSSFYGHDCENCSNKNKRQCLQCSNCGLCLKNNKLTCVKGSVWSPYDKSIQCDKWISSDPFGRYANTFNCPKSNKIIN